MMDVMRKAIYMLSVLCVAALWGGCQRGGGEETADAVVLAAGGMAARTRAMLKVQDGCSNFCSLPTVTKSSSTASFVSYF